ncbi:MAG: glucans biosynthesis glucosyltransferase MdoH [Pseudomonadota bacterium]
MTAPFPDPDLMPPEAPLEMPRQCLKHRFTDPSVPKVRRQVPAFERFFLFGFTAAATTGLAFIFADWFRSDGIDALEGTVIGLAAFTFFWIALSVAMALLGCLPQRSRRPESAVPLDTALLLPIYDEPIEDIGRNIRVMLEDLNRQPSDHRFTLYVLSDTRDPMNVAAEMRMVAKLRRGFGAGRIHYRHRTQNTRYKAGNIEDWVTRWGARHDAMLVLDADSVMTGAAILGLADALSAEPSLGLVQSIPKLFGARSLFARLQQFSNTIYGTTLARGLAAWSGDEANYWGHNAIMRVRAFADCAGLPELPGRAPFGGTVLSHDFIEAALMRRAGWRIRFLPAIEGSYEETPPNLIAHIARDRRWCQGNLQHLRMLFAAGFKGVSRMHLFQGAMAYCASLGWFALLILWVVIGVQESREPVVYFDAANPLYVVWPEMDHFAKSVILCFVYGMLVAPKLIGAVRFWVLEPRLERVGGPLRFWASWVLEVIFSVLLAPLMMIQHITAVLRTLAGVDTGWKPRAGATLGVLGYLRFHAGEIAVGLGMIGVFAFGYLSVWLLPVAVCMILAPLLSVLTAREWGRAQAVLQTPQEVRPPRVLRRRAEEEPPSPEAAEPVAVPA